MHYYQFNIADYQTHTRHLSLIQDICYRRMLDWVYLHEKPLPSEPKEVARILLLNECLTDVEQVLNEYFTLVEHGWVNVRALSEIQSYNDKLHKASLAGKASGIARKNNIKQSVKKDKQTFNDRSTDVELNNNHKPLTNNQNKTIAKETFALPEWVNQEHWNIWLEKNKKKTDSQKQLALNKLKRWKDAGLDYKQALEDAAEGGWQGLHEPKQKGYTNQRDESRRIAASSIFTPENTKHLRTNQITEKDVFDA
jgi:uncharacterized protein YdaU (DUF1376 family)